MTTTRNIAPFSTTMLPAQIEPGMVVCLPDGTRGRITHKQETLIGDFADLRVENAFTARQAYLRRAGVEVITCGTCAGQIADGHGGPSHYPLGTCRMGGQRAHCSCNGCW